MRRKTALLRAAAGSVYAEPDPHYRSRSPAFFVFGFVKPCHRAALGGELVDVLHQGGAVSGVNEGFNACLAKGAYKIRYFVLPKEIAEFKLF